MFNKDKFCGKVKSCGMTLEQAAQCLGINSATLSRKINGSSDFTRNEIELLRQKLSLSFDDIKSIFFN